MPTSFDFFGYLTSSGGYVYGQIPDGNPFGFIGTGATYPQYFAVGNTSLATPSFPFADVQPQTASTPEPSTLPVLVIGILGLARVVQYRNWRKAHA